MIGKAGVQSKEYLSDYTATLVLPTHYSDGSGNDLLGIQVTREHLEYLRNEIDRYLSRTNDNTPALEKVSFVNNFNIKAETGLTEAQVLGVFGQVSEQVKQLLQTKSQQKQTQLQGELPTDHSSVTNKSEDIKQVNKADDKDSAPFKLNQSRVMSMKIGADKWEARTKLFSWTSDGLTDLVATADSEEAAREELDKKFSNLAGPMMNFIKFMSQAS